MPSSTYHHQAQPKARLPHRRARPMAGYNPRSSISPPRQAKVTPGSHMDKTTPGKGHARRPQQVAMLGRASSSAELGLPPRQLATAHNGAQPWSGNPSSPTSSSSPYRRAQLPGRHVGLPSPYRWAQLPRRHVGLPSPYRLPSGTTAREARKPLLSLLSGTAVREARWPPLSHNRVQGTSGRDLSPLPPAIAAQGGMPATTTQGVHRLAEDCGLAIRALLLESWLLESLLLELGFSSRARSSTGAHLTQDEVVCPSPDHHSTLVDGLSPFRRLPDTSSLTRPLPGIG
ncbi:hypothetical protein Dimus_034099 [Dionaea muscipula]